MGEYGAADTMALLSAAQRSFCPNKVVILVGAGAEDEQKGQGSEDGADRALFKEVLDAYGGVYAASEGAAAAYVCFDNACSRPVKSPEDLTKLLGTT